MVLCGCMAMQFRPQQQLPFAANKDLRRKQGVSYIGYNNHRCYAGAAHVDDGTKSQLMRTDCFDGIAALHEGHRETPGVSVASVVVRMPEIPDLRRTSHLGED